VMRRRDFQVSDRDHAAISMIDTLSPGDLITTARFTGRYFLIIAVHTTRQGPRDTAYTILSPSMKILYLRHAYVAAEGRLVRRGSTTCGTGQTLR
jgi:hypothetical protein